MNEIAVRHRRTMVVSPRGGTRQLEQVGVGGAREPPPDHRHIGTDTPSWTGGDQGACRTGSPAQGGGSGGPTTRRPTARSCRRELAKLGRRVCVMPGRAAPVCASVKENDKAPVSETRISVVPGRGVEEVQSILHLGGGSALVQAERRCCRPLGMSRRRGEPAVAVVSARCPGRAGLRGSPERRRDRRATSSQQGGRPAGGHRLNAEHGAVRGPDSRPAVIDPGQGFQPGSAMATALDRLDALIHRRPCVEKARAEGGRGPLAGGQRPQPLAAGA